MAKAKAKKKTTRSVTAKKPAKAAKKAASASAKKTPKKAAAEKAVSRPAAEKTATKPQARKPVAPSAPAQESNWTDAIKAALERRHQQPSYPGSGSNSWKNRPKH